MNEQIDPSSLGLKALAERSSQFVGGRFEPGEGAFFEVIDPSYGHIAARVAGASTDQVKRMIACAKTAQPEWEKLPREERVSRLRRFIAEIRERSDDLRRVLIEEAGFPGGVAPSAAGIAFFQTLAGMSQAEDTLDLFLTMPEVEDNPVPLAQRITGLGQLVQSVMRYSAVGVVAGIAAYNYPIYTAIWKVVPALVTGNAMILRPSPLTPLSALVFGQAAIAAELPEGILSIMMEGGIAGAQLLSEHPDVDMIAFTGSSAVGVRVMQQAAPSMKRLQLELGGKSAQIFLPDAVDKAIGAAATVCLAHAGQGCVLGTRLFVPEDRKAEVVAGITAALSQVRIGPADAADTVLGPLISAAQVDRCEHFVKLAVAAGAKIACGGKRPPGLGKGFFFEPTVLDAPDNSNPAAQEEIFGPVVTVIGYRDIDHAVEMANDSPYGLSGYVFGADRRAALGVALRLKTGSVNVNGGLNSAYSSSGGMGLSGVGRERGREGLRLYQNVVNLTLAA